MRRMVVECENGDRYEQPLEDRQRLRLTKGGKVFLIAPGEKPIGTEDLGSRATAIYELVEEARA